jgi:uroporphyrinogen-III synthase/uroporphyrinogen III methyltransferase/synthase
VSHEELRKASQNLSLRGRLVAVTRARSDEDALSARLVELGARLFEAPAILIEPPASCDELDSALRTLDSAAWVVFASGNAVEHTLERASRLGIPAAALARPRLAAIGAATAARLTRRLRAPDLVPPDARGASLAAAMATAVRGVRVLVPRAEEGRPELVNGLEEAGAQVVSPVAYRTVAASPESLAPLAEELDAGTIDAVTFASPSAVRSVVAALGPRARLLAKTVLAAIGPTTGSELRALGLPVSVQPARSSGVALADALAERLGPRDGLRGPVP